MKIRNGYVSNSSSSSFVVVGVKRNGDYDEIMENENFDNGIRSLYVEHSKYDYITGIVISDNEEIEERSISFSELHEMAKKISETLKVDINMVELITGTRPC